MSALRMILSRLAFSIFTTLCIHHPLRGLLCPAYALVVAGPFQRPGDPCGGDPTSFHPGEFREGLREHLRDAGLAQLTGGLLPTAIFILRDFVEGLPRSYEESAMVSGASPWQMVRDVVMPLLRPGMMVVGIWTFVQVWGAFLVPFVLLRTPERMPAAIAIYSFYTEAGTPILTLTSAYALLYAIPVLAMYLFVNARYGFRFFGGIKR